MKTRKVGLVEGSICLLGFGDSGGAFFFWKKKAVVVKLLELLVEKCFWVGDDSSSLLKDCDKLKPNCV